MLDTRNVINGKTKLILFWFVRNAAYILHRLLLITKLRASELQHRDSGAFLSLSSHNHT